MEVLARCFNLIYSRSNLVMHTNKSTLWIYLILIFVFLFLSEISIFEQAENLDNCKESKTRNERMT